MSQDVRTPGVKKLKYTDFAKLLISNEKDDQMALKRLIVQKPLKTCKNKKTKKISGFGNFGIPFDIYAETSINTEKGVNDWKHKTRYIPRASGS